MSLKSECFYSRIQLFLGLIASLCTLTNGGCESSSHALVENETTCKYHGLKNAQSLGGANVLWMRWGLFKREGRGRTSSAYIYERIAVE